jgi:hypothetical protein
MRFAAPALAAAAAIEATARLLPMAADSLGGSIARIGAFAAIWIPFAWAFGREEIAQLRGSLSRRASTAIS